MVYLLLLVIGGCVGAYIAWVQARSMCKKEMDSLREIMGEFKGQEQANNFTADSYRAVFADEYSISGHVDAASVVNPFTGYFNWDASAVL